MNPYKEGDAAVKVHKIMLHIKEENKKTNYFILLLLLGAFVWITLRALKTTYDNDSWWLIATGREIVKNGFPTYNPWSIHDGMKIVIQQWIPSVILYLLNSVGKMPLIELYVAILIGLFTFLLYRMCRSCSDCRCGGEILFAVILIALYPISGYFSCRPQIFSMAAYAGIIWLLELYRKTGKVKYVWWLPVITLIHVNFHASMVLYDLFIIGLYWIPDIPGMINKRFDNCIVEFAGSDYPRKPLFLMGIASALATLINPYGWKGALYLLESYGAAGYQNYIEEMKPLQMYSIGGFAVLAIMVLGCIVIGHNGNKKIHFPLTCLFLISIILTIQHVRNVWFTPLFALPLIADGIGNLQIDFSRFKIFRRKIIYVIEVLVLLDFIIVYGYANVWPTMVDYINISKADEIDLPQKAADYMAKYAEENGLKASDIKVFNSFNNGGLLEYHGFKVLMDARPELWEPSITGLDEHYYREFVDFSSGNMEIFEMINKYPFDFYIVREGGLLEAYMQEHDDQYEIVEECNGYNLWGNVDN